MSISLAEAYSKYGDQSLTLSGKVRRVQSIRTAAIGGLILIVASAALATLMLHFKIFDPLPLFGCSLVLAGGLIATGVGVKRLYYPLSEDVINKYLTKNFIPQPPLR